MKLAQEYNKKIKEELTKQFKYTNVMQVPKLEKVCINMGIGAEANDAKAVEQSAKEIEAITGQKPVLTKAKNAIATFKIREGQAIGVKVTLRGEKMWNFVRNLVSIALPRVRDFKGLAKNSFDGNGNYTMGVKEQIIFPEINFDQVKRVKGFNITFVTSTKDKDQARALLKAIGLPIIM
mgnify:CR=1 FL=1